MTFKDLDLFKSIETLKTKRLILRKLKKADLDDVFEYSSDPAVSQFLLWAPHKNKRITASYLKRVEKLYKEGQFFDWAIEYQGKMIGTCGFSKIDIMKDKGEIGYVLNRNYWGLGIATEAASTVIDFGFMVLELKTIEARYIIGNERSPVVMRKCGMIPKEGQTEAISVGGLEKHIGTFVITKEDYIKNINFKGCRT